MDHVYRKDDNDNDNDINNDIINSDHDSKNGMILPSFSSFN